MGLDCDSLSYQVPTSNQGGTRQDPGLVFGNPYSGKNFAIRAGKPLPASRSPTKFFFI